MGADRGVLACINFVYIHESKLLLVQILDSKMIFSFLELGYFRCFLQLSAGHAFRVQVTITLY